jgi:hypothetical protein
MAAKAPERSARRRILVPMMMMMLALAAAPVFAGDEAPLPKVKEFYRPPAPSYVGEIVQRPEDGRWDLILRTKNDYPCANAHVNAVSVVKGDRVTVNIDKRKPVIQPSLCLTPPGPASYSLAMPAFNRPLELDIIQGENRDYYSLSVASGRASVATLHAGFTFFLRKDPR